MNKDQDPALLLRRDSNFVTEAPESLLHGRHALFQVDGFVPKFLLSACLSSASLRPAERAPGDGSGNFIAAHIAIRGRHHVFIAFAPQLFPASVVSAAELSEDAPDRSPPE